MELDDILVFRLLIMLSVLTMSRTSPLRSSSVWKLNIPLGKNRFLCHCSLLLFIMEAYIIRALANFGIFSSFYHKYSKNLNITSMHKFWRQSIEVKITKIFARYGGRATSGQCSFAIIIMCVQSIVGVIISVSCCII